MSGTESILPSKFGWYQLRHGTQIPYMYMYCCHCLSYILFTELRRRNRAICYTASCSGADSFCYQLILHQASIRRVCL